ncbi:hypothetical protein PHYBLDRAFT_147475 [Phycomyces blakesleeanus NRRL 1555(-)]|uniref:Reverse transcriptase domain-containing protein n=1 Tax=Phycomyces blakesleeanus (strain ATCC 8743b / DSM 1359 / FGSC 10004 / NBRC 33097 / NRRL 1555) TaxID=763407 RepID=A0A163A880_PHYB8|nr:hypothetical protein PHYBLDRAFT_147475 [Phycomyces blakesleeanus NRRL 1555(-)]OAD71721.1 hypothetical protein PHYBLDRAFT_147475 [Phycomyces blakesleeanus NRRL 1555(-)]|eukprot:XP_018289761.1 hypothetical protein PHYBLDRAFT_147475 [Phycomyces blakesleeanus NRRL 1555(-)]
MNKPEELCIGTWTWIEAKLRTGTRLWIRTSLAKRNPGLSADEAVKRITTNGPISYSPVLTKAARDFHRQFCSSSIHYAYAYSDLAIFRNFLSVPYIHLTWSDSCLVAVSFKLTATHETENGLCRNNPQIACNPTFCDKLEDYIYTISFTKYSTQTLATLEARLQNKRCGIHIIIERRTDSTTRHWFLLANGPGKLTISRAVTRQTHENGEISAEYLRCTVSERQSRKNTNPLRHSSTDHLHTAIASMTEAAAAFCEASYTPKQVDQIPIDNVLHNLPQDFYLSNTRCSSLAATSSVANIREGILTQVYNKVITGGRFLPSWKVICVFLLPKKDNLSLLKILRQITHVNADAKGFTSLLKARMVKAARSILTPSTSPSGIRLLLDQEKAYDRLNSNYLKQVIVRICHTRHFQLTLFSSHKATLLCRQSFGFPLADPEYIMVTAPQHHIATCAPASNARINLHYLGFPAIFFLTQTTTSAHKYQALSIRGCAPVMNSFIFSKFWQLFYVVSVSGTFFANVEYRITRFLQDRSFIPVKMGGLKALNREFQQGALQLHCL